MPSKLEQLQQQYRRQLLQEKEERMIKIHTESQQKALSKVARYNGYSSVPTVNTHPPVPAPHHSPVKKGSPGVDRSRPLPPISKDRNTASTRASPVSAPTDNNYTSKMPSVNNSRSKSVDFVDSPRQSPPKGLQNERGNQQNERGNQLNERGNQQNERGSLRNGYTKVSETNHHQFQFTQHSETTRVTTQHVEQRSKPVEPKPAQNLESKHPQQVEPKPTPQEKKPDPDTLARLKQAELQRLRAKARDETPPPRHNGFSSDTVTRSSTTNASTVQRRAPAAAKPPTTTTPRTRPSFQNATAASSRKAAAPGSRPTPRGAPAAALSVAGRKPPGPGQEQCRICGRNFNTDRIEKHASICAKAAQKKVKVFDATKMRVKGTEAEQFVKKGTAAKVEPKAKQSNWRKKHNEFMEAIRQAKMVQQHLARGGKVSDLPPPPPSDTSDYVQCPYCNRKFNEGVAERHIPKCKNILSNKKNPAPRKK